MKQISAHELQEMLAGSPQEKPLLLDVREPWEWEIARLDGSTLVPMGQIPGKVDELDRTRSTVVICHHGRRSLQVIAFLQRFGFTNLHNLTGGIDAWSREVDPRIATY